MKRRSQSRARRCCASPRSASSAVGTLLVTGIVNTWYLVGSVAALTGTYYGQLLLAKIASVLRHGRDRRRQPAMRFTPRFAEREHERDTVAQFLDCAATPSIEALAGAVIICIVAVLGTKPPASHANHHPAYGALPADAAFVHIHTEQGMADVMIEPGRVGPAHATIHLWNDDFEPLDGREREIFRRSAGGGSKRADKRMPPCKTPTARGRSTESTFATRQLDGHGRRRRSVPTTASSLTPRS